MMKKLIVFLLLISSFGGIAQSYQENLEKYWYYRNRLKEKFMYFNGNAGVQGSHLMAENRDEDDIVPYIRWADGVWWLGHYIGVLALEYRLLKDNGQVCTETLNELNLALDTYYRLDFNAEPCFNDFIGNTTGDPSTNGFFLRDDLDENCSSYFDNLKIFAGYSSCQNGEEENVNSQDQNILMFLGLDLANKLVDDPNIQNRVDNIAELVIGSMNWFNPLALGYVWEIRNPMTLGVPPGGNVYELYSYCWAEAESAWAITNNNEHKGYSSNHKPQFDIAQSLTWEMLQGGNPLLKKYEGYYTMVLSTIVNDGGGYSPDCDHNSYDWLCEMYDNTKAYEGMESNIGLFPHLAAISEVLHGYNGTNRRTASFYENNFLNSAPPCGSFNSLDPINPCPSPPWHTMSLFCPWHRNSQFRERGDFNMLDYMMLYNAYFYDYHRFSMHESVTSYSVCPELVELPPPHVPFWIYTVDMPKKVSAIKLVEAYDEINNGGGIVFKSGEKIKMMPGFRANAGSLVKAIIDESLLLQPYYAKTNTDPCAGGTFETKSVAYTPLNIPINNNHSQFQDGIRYVKNDSITKSFSVQNASSELLMIENSKDTNSKYYIFPNPTNGTFSISYPDKVKISLVEIFDPIGNKIFSSTDNNTPIFEYDLTTYKSGIYYVKITANEYSCNLKIVKY